MRLGKAAFIAAMVVSLSAQANDNVVVDLSVLDSINETFMSPNEPLFPVLPKKAKAVKSKPKKKVVKSVQQAPKVEIKEVVEDIVVVDKEPVYQPENTQVKQENTDVVEKVAEDPKPQELSQEPIVAPEFKTEDAAPEVVTGTAVTESKVEEQPVAFKESGSAIITPQAPVATDDLVSESKLEETPKLLVEENVTAPVADIDNSIVFAAGSDELSPENMAKIDTIVASFGDLSANKIAIYSYNMDDGVDSFKKKRISLNRAVEVRGYLIKQGHKNFSIKVININTDSEKLNTVELEKI